MAERDFECVRIGSHYCFLINWAESMMGVGYGNVRSTIRNHPEEFKEGEDFITVSKELAGQIGMKAKAGYIKRIMNQWTPKRMLTMEGVEHLAKWYSSYREVGNPFEEGFKLTTVYNDTPIEDEADAIEENIETLEVVQPKPLNIADVLKIKDGKVDGRSLHECLGIETQYTVWFPRQVEYGFTEGRDFSPKMVENPISGGRPSINHDLTINMAKHLAAIQKTPLGMQVRQYLIDTEEAKQELAQPNMTEMFFMAAQAMMEVQREQETLKAKQIAIEARYEAQAKEIASMKEILALRPENWREDCRKIVNRIANKRGNGKDDYQNVWNEIYTVLEARIHVSLGQRKKNRQKRMAEAGASKTAIKNLTKLDVIGDDPKLIEGVISIVKEFAIKEGLTITADHNVIEFKVVESKAKEEVTP